MTRVDVLEGRVVMHLGDVCAVLDAMKPESVDCIVTSPPYWGLRDYGVAGQIGLEPTWQEHIAVMVGVFERLRRVLKKTGTAWVNYGDCYASTVNGRSAADVKALGNDDRTFRDKPFSTVQGVLKPKDLVMMPNRIAIALQEAGWWVRAENIWAKPNPMPESIKDRPATSHEKIFMLTKSERYFYDAEAVRVRRTSFGAYKQPDGWDTGEGAHGSFHRKGREKGAPAKPDKQRGHARPHAGFNDRWDGMSKSDSQAKGRNLRNYERAGVDVWEIATHAFPGAHFATFPPALAERCILAGCPKDGVVLDPFGGAGTTALVAARHGRRAVLIELNPDYAQLARDRIEKEWRVAPPKASAECGPLFAGVV